MVTRVVRRVADRDLRPLNTGLVRTKGVDRHLPIAYI
jgi:hypothetical protein